MRLTDRLLNLAVARGYLSPQQLGEALRLRDQLQDESRPDGLPEFLQPFLNPAQLRELYEAGAALEGITPRVASPGATDWFAAGSPTVASTASPSPAPAPLARPAGRFTSERLRESMRRIGPYVIEQEIARGGMGVVYVAKHVQLGRAVALKLLPMDVADEAAVERFLLEAQTAARVVHPNIVRVHEAGVFEDQRFIAMDLVEGESLGARLRRAGPLGPTEAAGLIRSLANALATAHAAGVLHRDVKPANVLLGHDGRARLADFGVAKDLRESRGLTLTGEMVGTPAYASPEQIGGVRGRVDARTDVYGLGATLYHALTGSAPFQGATAVNLMHKVFNDAPTPPSELADVPPDLETICLACLAKSPEDRYASAADLEADLERFLEGEAVERKALRRSPWLALAVAGVGVVGVLGAALTLRPQAAAPGELPGDVASLVSAAPAEVRDPLETALALSGPGFVQNEALEVVDAWLVSSGPEGLRVQGRGGNSGPGVRVPLEVFAQGRIELELELSVARLEPGVTLDLVVAPTAPDAEPWGVSLSADTPTAHLRVEPRPSLWAGKGEAAISAAASRRVSSGSFRLRLVYEPDTPGLELFSGSERLCALPLPAPLAKGISVVTLALSGRSRLGVSSGTWEALADVQLRSLRVRAERRAVAVVARDGSYPESCRLSRRVLNGELGSVREKLNELYRSPNSDTRANATYHLTVAHGDPEWRVGRLRFLHEAARALVEPSGSRRAGGKWYERRWKTDLLWLDEALVEALVQLTVADERLAGRSIEPAVLAKVASDCVGRNAARPRSVLLFLAAGEVASRDYPQDFGIAWTRLGRFDKALGLLEPLERATPGSTEGWAGLAAYRQGAFERAVDLWGGGVGAFSALLEDARRRLR